MVIKPGNVGDHLCALPFYLALAHRHGPLVLVTQKGRAGNPGAKDLFRSWSPFDAIVDLATPVWSGENKSILKGLKSHYRPKRVIHVPVEDYSTLRTIGLHGFWSGVFGPDVVGFLPVAERRKRRELAQNGRLRTEATRLLEWGTTKLGLEPVDPEPVVAEWLTLIRTSCRRDVIDGPFVLIAAGSNDSIKRWPLDRYVQIAEHIESDLHLTPVWVGSLSDRATLEGAGHQIPGISLIGKTTLEEMLLLTSEAQLVVSNDSMAGHMAALTKTPCISVFSGRTLPGLWWPHNAEGTVIQKRVPCEGCELRVISDCAKGHVCMETITTREVAALVEAKLRWVASDRPIAAS